MYASVFILHDLIISW